MAKGYVYIPGGHLDGPTPLPYTRDASDTFPDAAKNHRNDWAHDILSVAHLFSASMMTSPITNRSQTTHTKCASGTFSLCSIIVCMSYFDKPAYSACLQASACTL
jgi:hypothetical protein